MNKQMIVVALILIAVFLGIGAFILFQKNSQSNSMMNKDESMMPANNLSDESSNAMMKKEESAMDESVMTEKSMSDSRYVPYTKSALDNAADDRRVLFFYASWCPTCKPADADFSQNESKIPEDLTLIRVNYNDPETDQEEKDLAAQYGVTYQHTFVQIDREGREVTKWNGGKIDELLSNIK